MMRLHRTTQALLDHLANQWYAIEAGREVQGLLPGGVFNREKFLGNFAHELEEP